MSDQFQLYSHHQHIYVATEFSKKSIPCLQIKTQWLILVRNLRLTMWYNLYSWVNDHLSSHLRFLKYLQVLAISKKSLIYQHEIFFTDVIKKMCHLQCSFSVTLLIWTLQCSIIQKEYSINQALIASNHVLCVQIQHISHLNKSAAILKFVNVSTHGHVIIGTINQTSSVPLNEIDRN